MTSVLSAKSRKRTFTRLVCKTPLTRPDPTMSSQTAALNDFDSNSMLEVDLRSDTKTRPGKGMRERMAAAIVGDDVFHEDPTVKELESRMAALLGKEAALFVPAATMANLLAVMVHCGERSCEAIVGERDHIFRAEQGGMAHIAGVQAYALPQDPADGTFSLQGVRERIRNYKDDHCPKTAMIAVENTQNYYGGLILPLEWIDELNKIGKEHEIPTHMDGCRLFNASIASGVPAKRIVEGFSSVTICLCKGLGAPVGALLVGDTEFIRLARRYRKTLGGGMRQVGILAAAGLYCIDHMIDRLQEDHANAKLIGKAIHELQSPAGWVELSKLQTNMVALHVQPKIPVSKVCERMATVLEKEKADIGDDAVKVLAKPIGGSNSIRLVTHCDISTEMSQKAAVKICYILQELAQNYAL